MNSKHDNQQLERFLRRLVGAYAQALRQFDDDLTRICREFGVRDVRLTDSLTATPAGTPGPERIAVPIADRATLSIRWRGTVCFLGNTLLYRLYEKLSLRPNRYFTYSELLADVWGGPRSTPTIHNLVKRLRDRLLTAGMRSVADAIDGRVRGHYAFRVDWLVAKNQTEIKP